jgi:hypothetical protein
VCVCVRARGGGCVQDECIAVFSQHSFTMLRCIFDHYAKVCRPQWLGL